MLPTTAKAQMAAKVQSPEGREVYARRTVIVEPVFGQIKEVRGFRRFLLRGMQKLRGEWRLVCRSHLLLKRWRYGCVAVAASAEKRAIGEVGEGPFQGVRPPERPPWLCNAV